MVSDVVGWNTTTVELVTWIADREIGSSGGCYCETIVETSTVLVEVNSGSRLH